MKGEGVTEAYCIVKFFFEHIVLFVTLAGNITLAAIFVYALIKLLKDEGGL